MKKWLFLGMFVAIISAQAKAENDSPLAISGSYTGDAVSNLSGGIKSGSAYLGMATIGLTVNSEALIPAWKGGQFHALGANTHGATPSADLLGDIQVASNLEAGNHTYIQELWFKQRIGAVEFTAGLQDLAADFANTDYGALFLNSSFGVKSTLSHNLAVPIFPLTNLGLTLRWDIAPRWSWLAAVYDGAPTPFDDGNPYNLCWNIGDDGFFAIAELQHTETVNGLDGAYKLGAYRANKPNITGFYADINQPLWRSGERELGAFLQVSYAPSENSFCDHYYGLGFQYKSLFSSSGKDVLGVAFNHEHFKGELKSESVAELTYQYNLLDNLYIQPDIQYIFNPAGTGETLNNALAFTLRFRFEF